MFKKALQIVVTFSLLVGGYLGYVQGFGIVEDLLDRSSLVEALPFPETEAKSALRATELARESFGASHWAARKPKIRYYDAVRGYYLFAENYERLDEGKRLRIWPFALVWSSKDGQSRKTATSDEAVIDFSQPFLKVESGQESSHVVHAKMVGDVWLRDDKGTRDDPTDDLRVGPLSEPLEYDEATLQITTGSLVFLQDRDMTINGLGMMIQLRRKVPIPGEVAAPGSSGFDAESIRLYKDIHVVVKNVGSNGILPGQARPEKGGQTPLDLRADNEMKITLPRPIPVVLIGPPDLNRPPEPTLVRFQVNVRVLRGTITPDQLNCDTLDLTLMPAPKLDEAAVPVAGQPPAGSGGPLTDLKLRKALAQGHGVWLQSEVQGMKARCAELKYEKADEPGVPDKTYLNGGSARKLWVEKVEYDVKGPDPSVIKSILTLNSLDATIFDYGPGGTSKIIARGPGKTEDRPARNASVTHTAYWEDEMTLLTWRDAPVGPDGKPLAVAANAATPAPRGILRRLITLTGVSKLIDHKDPTTLDARKSIVAEFESSPEATPTGGDGATRIKWLQGFEDVHLTAPQKTLTARDQLDAKFVPRMMAAIPIPLGTPAATGNVASYVAPAPSMAARPASPINPDSSLPEAPPPAPDQPIDARANRVWATIVMGEGEKARNELKDAQLRGGVMVHQEPAPGKSLGNDATGEALDLFGQGNGLMKFVVASEPPQAQIPRAKLASDEKVRRASAPTLAKVEFEGRTIEAPLIGLDQQNDYAWAQGAGRFLELTDRGLLDDKSVGPDGRRIVARPVGPTPNKVRLEITWTDEMKFFGKSTDLKGRPAAKVEFRGVSREVQTPDRPREFRRGVIARMEDAGIDSDTMDVYMDKVISLNKPKTKTDPEPNAEIALMDCRGQNSVEDGKLKYAGVDVTSQKLYPGTRIVKEKYRIRHTHVVYDRQTGDFEAPGAGTTYLYKRKEDKGKPRPSVIPVAGPGSRSNPELTIDPKTLPPLELTKVVYVEGMRGRFGTSKTQTDVEKRHAEFVGNVQAANATVAQPFSDIDFDRPNAADYMFLTSDILHVYTEPNLDRNKPARQLMNAQGNAAARTLDRLIQSDRITYDSATDLIYAFGDDDKEVVMTEQKSAGQQPNTIRGKSGRYNKTTKAGEIVDPQAIRLYDLASGFRPKPFYPDLGGTPKPMDPIKANRLPYMRPSRNSTERSGFTGH